MAPFKSGTMLQDRYEIASQFGSAEGTAAYLADDKATQERLLIWESDEQFKLQRRPPGVREYFEQGGKHYLAMRVEGQSLAMMLTASGRVDEKPAGMWLLQICRALGYWHNREEGALVCLRQGEISLADFHLTSHDLVMVPSYGDFGQARHPELPADEYRFQAPEQGEAVSPRSDVYALGGVLYCLLTGQPPTGPAERAKTRLAPVRRANPAVSAAMDKIVQKALQLDPQRRYPTAAEMAADLEELLLPALLEKQPEKKKPSLLVRAVPFIVTLLVLGCLVAVLQAVTGKGLHIKLPRLPSAPTPTYTPVTPTTPSPTHTPTPVPTSVPMVTQTPVPGLETILNQIRLDQFPDVIAYMSVLDWNREPVQDLTAQRFRVQQDGNDVVDFSAANVDAAQDPLAMAVVIDVSGSMKGDPVEKAKAAAASFVSRFNTDDRAMLIKFNHRITLVHELTTDKNAVVKSIESLDAVGDTALYDVIAQAADRLSKIEGRRAIILLTDGGDTSSSKYNLETAIAAANARSLPVFVIGLDSEDFTPAVMSRIATETGADYLYAPAPDALDALYQKIRGQLQNQYRIQFRSLHGADGGLHRLRIGMDVGTQQEIWTEKEYTSP